ncbi:acetate/propionate family kinase [Conexibacter sp. JD483]|uniref:acetate/propionate family kinase n=1 Tax=unclassified Conexibacter TaxID=2627773 RepID=UPI00271E5CD8|nr:MULTISPECIES: acetate/propionate family kinase [unclassified Conexibacter]MDO8187448.1 acetate/propionate family kinase [Conexibacter sp. CPCC 205706]MDO8198682.1 acetate/propionate family kinase [Conexibacter sp. CPCC 205762]MDR9369860.1 acetate/propionate family kinase [Conexibacter sp. JD483]
MRVLVVNTGSSSLKHTLVDSAAADPDAALLASGEERWEPGDTPGKHGEVLRAALADGAGEADAIGHRVVHGGARFEAPARIDDDVRAGIAEAAELAPLHNRAALEGIDAAREAFPTLPQVACFDTAFHRTLDAAAATYAIPGEWAREQGIRRFGFHGLNVSWCVERAHVLLGSARTRRLIVCHLGSGCSVSAVRDGRSADTTMGFTPLDGIPMATRSGALDPGLVLRLLQTGERTPELLDDALNHRSGLLGISERSADLRVLLELAAGRDGDVPASDDDAARAQLAIDVFVRGVASAVAALSTSLGGLDALVFTAGIGEHSAAIRTQVAARLAHLGVALDPRRNEAAEPDAELTPEGAKIAVLALRAREETVIARETAALLEE